MGKDAVPLDTLREQIAQAIAQVKAHEVPAACVRLAIQSAVQADDEQEAFRSKRIYVRKRILAWCEVELLDLAQRVLREFGSEDLADTISEMTVQAEHRVSELVRRDVLKVIDRLPTLFGELPLIESLSEVFGAVAIQDGPGVRPSRHTLQGRILQHYVHNETDWSHGELLMECGVLTCSQTRFFSLLTKLLHPVVRRDAEQTELAAAISTALRRDGFVVRQTDTQSGFALYGVVRAQTGVGGSMKNLIFASIGMKPELVFRDAVNNDVEIVSKRPGNTY